MNWGDSGVRELLASKGFHVIRYDNRDNGRSSSMTGRVSRADVVRAVSGLRATAPYSLVDMAADGIGLLDHLGIDSAHVAGISMGGMIVQTMALHHPGRIRSVTSIMSTTGKRTVGWQHPSLSSKLPAKHPAAGGHNLRTCGALDQADGPPATPTGA